MSSVFTTCEDFRLLLLLQLGSLVIRFVSVCELIQRRSFFGITRVRFIPRLLLVLPAYAGFSAKFQ